MNSREMDFERELGLGELLRGYEAARLSAAIETLLGVPFRLRGHDGFELGSAQVSGGERVDIGGALDPAGFIQAQCERPRLEAAASLVDALVQGGRRYFMASELHLAAVHEDYEQLQQKHRALQASEARYRELNRELEARVAQQVRTIEQGQRQLYLTEKLASVGQLAAGVAHEINNPIGFVGSNLATAEGYLRQLSTILQRCRTKGADSVGDALWRDVETTLEDFTDLLRESRQGAERIARIVADLKGVSGVDQPTDTDANLNEIVRAVCNVVAPQLRDQGTLEVELGTPVMVRVRVGQIGQALLNLLLNAGQAIAPGGVVRVETFVINGKARVVVSDNGEGIAEENLPRLFEPFFTTRAVGKGTGLGLTVARDLVRAHGGDIEVESRPGLGSTFTLVLPVWQGG